MNSIVATVKWQMAQRMMNTALKQLQILVWVSQSCLPIQGGHFRFAFFQIRFVPSKLFKNGTLVENWPSVQDPTLKKQTGNYHPVDYVLSSATMTNQCPTKRCTDMKRNISRAMSSMMCPR